MSNYLTGSFSTRSTPQTQPIPGSTQVPNSAGGYAWQVNDWTRLERFLVLGSEGGSYYASEWKLTIANAEAVLRCIRMDGLRTVAKIAEVSVAGRAPKNDPAIFALALAASYDTIGPTPPFTHPSRVQADREQATRQAAMTALPTVCRTGTHLFQFINFVEEHRGWGRALRRAVGQWYTDKSLDRVGYQVVKYRQRAGWAHRDLLRLAHPAPGDAEVDALFRWLVGKTVEGSDVQLPTAVEAYEQAQRATGPKAIVELIGRYGDKLPREAIPPEHLTAEVWDALLRAGDGMPMTALIRNLATMTRLGLLAPMSDASRLVVEQLGDAERLRGARVHPLAVLVALKTYEQGRSARGIGMWQAVPAIVNALDGAFYASFGNIEATGKRTMLALDVSGSMGLQEIAGMPSITPRDASAAMALVTAAVEPNYVINGFCDTFVPLTITPRQRLDDVVRTISRLPFARTDCSLPMQHAMRNRLEIDTFIVYTDSETYAGRPHPSQALRQYREQTGIPAKLVVVGMVANEFTIADPNDGGMLDVVGMDTATPDVIAGFSRGALE